MTKTSTKPAATQEAVTTRLESVGRGDSDESPDRHQQIHNITPKIRHQGGDQNGCNQYHQEPGRRGNAQAIPIQGDQGGRILAMVATVIQPR